MSKAETMACLFCFLFSSAVDKRYFFLSACSSLHMHLHALTRDCWPACLSAGAQGAKITIRYLSVRSLASHVREVRKVRIIHGKEGFVQRAAAAFLAFPALASAR